ncbi:MAG: glycosyltransferase [Oscillospiraceae bacterium]|jgi:glycosyltransferase involved in cell wall biosynthesis|nr:glycosyltransferase [Oscillospiraceae bacterium]
MRILMLIHRLADNSPYCFYVHEQAKALAAAGHRVSVIAPVPSLPGYALLRPQAAAIAKTTPRRAVVDGIPVAYPRFPALGNAGVRALGGRAMAWAALPEACRQHRVEPFDLIHAHMLPVEGHAALLMGRRLGIPAVVTVHGTDVLRCFPRNRRPGARNRRLCRDAHALTAVSHLLAGRLSPWRGTVVPVVPNGVDLSLIPPVTRNLPRRILTGGTLKARKCMHTTLDAFLALAPDFTDATLTIFGEGPDRASLEAKIAQRGMAGRVTLTGGLPHEQVLALMAQSDAFVMPSYAEGYGIVYIEAMAAGCIAVGSVGEGIADLIRDGENGFLVPAADAQSLIPVMRRLLAGDDGLAVIRAKGRADARTLTWARNAAAYEDIYRQVLTGGPDVRRYRPLSQQRRLPHG